MDEKQQAETDDQIYRAYLDGIRGIHPLKNEDALLLHTAHAMGFISHARGDVGVKAAVVETARRLLTEPAAEESAPAPRRGGRPAKLAQPPKKKPHPMTSAVRRAAGTKPVACPVHGCEAPGIRAKMNFCAEHAGALPKAERQRLRQMQRAHAADAQAE